MPFDQVSKDSTERAKEKLEGFGASPCKCTSSGFPTSVTPNDINKHLVSSVTVCFLVSGNAVG